ncbi:hypothetical protein [Streptomyces sp. NPDC001985]|uniref:hypothetical protein n=1 Tax=Streptomyces sp. NPDC001985 TaxID=3154406 RepID=UPI00332B4CDA
MSTIIRKLGAAAVAVLLVPFWAVEAQAGTGPVSRISPTSDVTIPRGTTVELARHTLTLAAGEKRHLRSRLEATSSTTKIVGMTSRIKCVNSTGQTVGRIAASARNHEGYDTTSYAVDGHLPILTDQLLTAPAAGTYTCYLYGSAYSSIPDPYHLTAVASGTWLETTTTDQAGARWWENPNCESDGSGSCTYVGAGAADDAWVFYNDGTPVHKWQPHPAATSVSAQANVELTTCPTGSRSCSAGMGKFPRGTNAVVDMRLDFIQLTSTGHTCVTNSTTLSRKTISDDAHHYVTYFSLPDVPVSAGCDSRDFIMRVYVKHVSGQTVKIDGVQQPDPALSGTSLTNGIAFNNV